MAGLLVAIEGINFSGKTTLAALLADRQTGPVRNVVKFQFPGPDTAIGQLATNAVQRGGVESEALFALFAANRLEKRREIKAARSEGSVVICDRYCQSEYAYGAAAGLDQGWLQNLESLMPVADVVVLLDIDPLHALRRAPRDWIPDRFEEATFLARVREQYYRLAEDARSPSDPTWFRVDARQPVSDVGELVDTKLREIQTLLSR